MTNVDHEVPDAQRRPWQAVYAVRPSVLRTHLRDARSPTLFGILSSVPLSILVTSGNPMA